MKEFTYKDYIPANARVIVDYSKKQKVGFSYPIEWTYWKAVWRRAYPTFLAFWLFIHINPIIYLTIYIGIPYVLIRTIFFPYQYTTEATIVYFNFIYIFLPILITFFYLFGIPAIIVFFLALNKKRISKWIPIIGHWATKLNFRSKEIKFTKKDVVNKKAIIPVFNNIYLYYKGKRDFKKYLKKVEVLEIPFIYKHRNPLFPFKKNIEKNDYVFRAVFYFIKKPMNGSLNVTFI